MATEIRLVCDGCGRKGPPLQVAASKTCWLRSAARKLGWRHRPQRNLDICDRCVKAGREQEIVNARSRFVNEGTAARPTLGQLLTGEASGAGS